NPHESSIQTVEDALQPSKECILPLNGILLNPHESSIQTVEDALQPSKECILPLNGCRPPS
ncbi:hypothetical protein, partial [Bartonella sp. MR100HLJHH]|uniref:hypothetical protein n=1 Tax=Bartonella sp. MR100HLJHH TaxID=3243554 RepID=UPI0035CFD81C